jgi:alanine dehydrogenase
VPVKVGIPRERKTLEKRVALSPQGAKELTSRGHEVLIETEAGAEVHFYDRDYTAVGARICKNLEEVWGEADLLVKVKEPHKDEYPYFREDLALFDYLHLAGLPDVAQEIQQSKMCAIAYESVRAAGRLPLLEPMSEIAGKLSVINGSYFLLSQNGGRGILIGGAIGVPKARVAILGAGVAGRNACEMALGLGADVTLLDVRHDALESAKAHFGSRVNTSYSTPTSVMEQCQSAELLIGSVLIPGAAAPKIVSREAIKLMKPGSVFVDISIDQGGCGETMRPTSLDNPVF